jgi:hypothetical protein
MAHMQGKAISDDNPYFAGMDVTMAHPDLRVYGTKRVWP